MLSGLHNNFHVMPQRHKEPHQPFDRISTELATQHSRNFGLIDSHEFCGRCLSQLSLADNLAEANHQTGLD